MPTSPPDVRAPGPRRQAGEPAGRDADRTRPEAAAALRWRLIQEGPCPGARNMAVDHALALELADSEAVLRLYRWRRPTVSFGRNEPVHGLYSPRVARERGIEYVRRPTGGRAVLHRDEVTYAVVVPTRALGGARAAYRRINEALAASLQRVGVSVAPAPRAMTPGLGAGPCFAAPATGELVAGGGKLVGSAQVRVGRALLQHGSILLSGDQSDLALLSGGVVEDGIRSASLSALSGDVDEERLRGALAATFPGSLGGRWEEGDLRPEESRRAVRLEKERYTDTAWTWRR